VNCGSIAKTGELNVAAPRLNIALASPEDRPFIYRLRHEIYARELGQYPENPAEQLVDAVDAFNVCIRASAAGGRTVGFISITPPGHKYSLEKYLARAELPFPVDDALYEVRLLGVDRGFWGSLAAAGLLYASFRWVEHQGGSRIMALGRSEVIPMYKKIGFQLHSCQVHAGAVTFELISVKLVAVSNTLADYARVLRKLETEVDWELEAFDGQPRLV
jgi:hypothetical protein